jgi:hypothetical protein
MYLVVKASLHPTAPEYQSRLYLLEHAQWGTNNLIWNGEPDALPIRPRTYDCDGSDPNHCDLFDPQDTFQPMDNLALAYVTEDRIVDPVTGQTEPHPGRLMLVYSVWSDVTQVVKHLPRVAYSYPYDYFALWMREGYASNNELKIQGMGEPGSRASYSLLAEPGLDANPRMAFKINDGPIGFWPFADGVRDVAVYDHNDWQVIRYSLCFYLVNQWCLERPGEEPKCDGESRRQLATARCGYLENPWLPPVADYPITMKP